MLKTLHIRQYALIEELAVEFGKGLAIITGETGAGKSIIIGALGLILGERADVSMVRKGSEKAVVEAALHIDGLPELNRLLSENGIEPGKELILRREISAKGQNRCFINDTPATNAVLKEVGDLLVDLHGQHEHQSLLRPETHVTTVDEYSGNEKLLKDYRAAYEEALATLSAIDELLSKEQQLTERRELYQFQLNEIDSVAPQAGEDERLETELKIMQHSEQLHAITENLYRMLYDGDNAIHDQLVLARNQLEHLSAIDETFNESTKEMDSATAIVKELAKSVQDYNARIEFSPERIEELRTRIGALSLLKKKYGGTVVAVLQHREKIGRELSLAENFQSEIARLKKDLEANRKDCTERAFKLSASRKEAAKKIDREVVHTLAELGIPKARFETKIIYQETEKDDHSVVVQGKQAYSADTNGIDQVEFYIATNAGEDLKPLSKVASGGEISRVMLALKTILSNSAKIPLLIFDEIDVGISGRIAQAVGQSLKNLSVVHQVIAITHLPQIAGFGDHHFAVEKSETQQRVVTRMKELTAKERVLEIAKLMSGEKVTEAALQGARELISIKGDS
jgi:DNA repair protein RecN (Recombination protein N)